MNQKGMSLIEILIALALLALAGSFIATKVFDRYYEGQRNAAIIQMQNISSALQEFRRHCNQFPTTEQGLEALIQKPTTGPECKRYAPNGYIEGGKVPVDAWDNPFSYTSDGKTFTIKSLGADGLPDGEGKDADIELGKENSGSGSTPSK